MQAKYLQPILSVPAESYSYCRVIQVVQLYHHIITRFTVECTLYCTFYSLLNIIILNFNSPVLLNQLGNIFPYRSSSTGSILENMLPVQLGVYFTIHSQQNQFILENIAARAIQRLYSSNIALPGKTILGLYLRMSVL